MKKITFYRRFEADILAGRKTITLRDAQDSDYNTGEKVTVSRYEDDVFFCDIQIINVTPVHFEQLDEHHARQENMSLEELKDVITEIYPGITKLYSIEFELCQ